MNSRYSFSHRSSSSGTIDKFSGVPLNPTTVSNHCKQIIATSFAPRISLITSEDVDLLTRETGSGYSNLQQLLQFFGDSIKGKITIKDAKLISRTREKMSLRFINPTYDNKSYNNSATTRSDYYGNRLFNEYELSQLMTHFIKKTEELAALSTSLEQHWGIRNSIYLKFFSKICATTTDPGLEIVPFETFNHPVACVIAISSRCPDPLQTASLLLEKSKQNIPEFIHPNFLRTILYIHDESSSDIDSEKKSKLIIDQLRAKYGNNAFMIRINKPLEKPDDETSYLTTKKLDYSSVTSINDELNSMKTNKSESNLIHEDDYNSITEYIKILLIQSVIPFMEKCITVWEDEVASTRKSFSGRLKKYFGGSSTASQASQLLAYNSANKYYPSASIEAMLRKLADYSFMLRDYQHAFDTYQLLHKDFLKDKAWAYLASSQEMSVISYLMFNPVITAKTRLGLLVPLVDSSTYSYISRCNSKTYAFRCILMFSELLCTCKDANSASSVASKWLLKIIGDELTDELGKALIFERIANCYSIHDFNWAIAQAQKLRYEDDSILVKRLERSLSLSSETGSMSSTILTAPTISIVNEPSKIGSEQMVNINDTATEVNIDDNEQAIFNQDHKVTYSNDQLTTGYFRTRKTALWQLIAAKQWYTMNEITETQCCIENVNRIYNKLDWGNREDGLLHQLTENCTIAYTKQIEALTNNNISSSLPSSQSQQTSA